MFYLLNFVIPNGPLVFCKTVRFYASITIFFSAYIFFLTWNLVPSGLNLCAGVYVVTSAIRQSVFIYLDGTLHKV